MINQSSLLADIFEDVTDRLQLLYLHEYCSAEVHKTSSEGVQRNIKWGSAAQHQMRECSATSNEGVQRNIKWGSAAQH